MKHISVLGSTGSIGTQALEVIDLHEEFKVCALCANTNTKLIEQQIRKYKPRLAAMMDEKAAAELKALVADTDTTVLSGIEGFCECASMTEADTVLTAVVGVCGLIPTIEAIRAKKTIALANKETLVAGGSIVMPLAKEYGVSILPVDSEHSAIFQSLQGYNNKIKKILLTASGGPFFGKTKEEIFDMRPEQALKHPNWSMGAKITIDSASMMNKGLEVIEAKWLFDVSPDDIEVLVHRQSIVHSMVQFEDNSVIAQMSVPDMRLPISYAFTYPQRFYCKTENPDFFEISKLTFEKPDFKTFECLSLAFEAIKRGGSLPCALNAANEVAVALFLQNQIRFGEISVLIKEVLSAYNVIDNPTLSDLLETDKAIREEMKGR